MFAVSSRSRFYLYLAPTDMRRGFDALAGLVRQQLKADPLSGDVFIFINRARDRIKFLVRDRSSGGPVEYLKGYRGYLQTDGYSCYQEILRLEGIEGVGCWAHARRYFVKALDHDREGSEWMLTRIGRLYEIEGQARQHGLDAAARQQLRQEQGVGILEEIRRWLDRPPPHALPRSALGKAVGYMTSQWHRLVKYVQDGRLEIDNNFIENAVRPIALGRKNYLFLGSEHGGRWGGIIYTLLVSAKLQGLEPFAYLNDVLSRIATHPYSQLEELLPQNWQPASTPS